MIINPSMTSSNVMMLVFADTVKWQQVPAAPLLFLLHIISPVHH